MPADGRPLPARAAFTLPAASCAAACQTVLTTLKTYGMILADNGSNWYFQGTADTRWTATQVDQLKQVPASVFRPSTSRASRCRPTPVRPCSRARPHTRPPAADRRHRPVQFTVTETIAAPRDDVVRALAEPGYYAGLGDASTGPGPRAAVGGDRGRDAPRPVRYAFAGSISGPAAMVVDVDKLTWVIETTYDTAAHSGTLVVVPDHYVGMLRCDGTLALDEADGGTLETVAGRLDVRVPLVGRSAERAIFGGFTTQLGGEAVALAAWCAANPSG